jgi:hypothetical protein
MLDSARTFEHTEQVVRSSYNSPSGDLLAAAFVEVSCFRRSLMMQPITLGAFPCSMSPTVSASMGRKHKFSVYKSSRYNHSKVVHSHGFNCILSSAFN